MSANEIMNNIIFGQRSVDEDRVVSGASFLDDLNVSSFEVVELIMAASTGQKNIIQQLKLTASTYRR